MRFTSPHFLSYLLLPLTLSLAACNTLPGKSGIPASHLAIRDANGNRIYHEQIQLSGKIAIHYEKNSQQQNLPGSFLWEQQTGLLKLTLFSPLGQTMARITQTPNYALLEQDGKAPVTAANLDDLLATTLRWPLPVAGMRDWLQGCLRKADGQCDMLQANDQTVQQSGWTIRYSSWHQDPAVLPKRIDLKRYTQEAGEVSLNIFLEAPEAQ